MHFHPYILGKDLHQSFFRFDYIIFLYETYAVCKPEYMGIHCYALFSESLGKDHVGRLSSHTRKSYELFIFSGDLPFVFVTKDL